MTKLQYRLKDYFNTNDKYIFWDEGLKKFFISKVFQSNNNAESHFYTVEGLQYKATTLKSLNLSEII